MRIKTAAVFALLACVLSLALFSGCALLNRPFYSQFPSGFTEKEEHFDPEGFQDHVDYCKYFYPSGEAFEKDERFMSVSEVGLEKVKGYFDNFRDWMETCDRLDEYDFDPRIISSDDLVCIHSEPHFTEYDDYTVCFFDVQSCTMYYIHSNI